MPQPCCLDGVHGLTAIDGFGEGLVDEAAHLFGGDGCAGVAAGDVRGAVAGGENVLRRRLSMAWASCSSLAEWRRTMAAVRMAPRGLAFPGAGNVGGGAVYRLVEIDLAADGGGGKEAEGAGDDGGLVGEDVAEEVFGEDDVEVARRVHEVHGHGVDELVLEGDVGVVAAEIGDGGAPELRDLEDVGLVDGGEFAAAAAGELEGDATRRGRSRRGCSAWC